MKPCYRLAVIVALTFLASPRFALAADLGPFENESDIGKVTHPGSTEYNAASHFFTISGGGENMWSTNDAFHFVWKRIAGDFTLSAAVEWLSQGGNAHRKACLLVRQTLDPDSPYVDVAMHGDGLTSLQYRLTKGGLTQEIKISQKQPTTAGLQRRGGTFLALIGKNGDLTPSGASIELVFKDPVYVGLGVCAHDNKTIETARFRKVSLE